jgi:hypothetical protein
MDGIVTIRLIAPALRAMLILVLTSGIAAAQDGTLPPSSARGGPWIVVGGSTTSILGDCTDCPADNYVHAGGLLAIVGTSLSQRADVGLELFWVPATSAAGDDIRSTYVTGVFQFRPWQSQGFFIRGSTGMAFIRNWIVTDQTGSKSFTSKAFALGLGAGWEWRFARRMGTQVFGAQHVATLGDLTTSTGIVENVVGNYWSVGGAIVIR